MTILMSGINMYSMALIMKVMLGWDIEVSIWISSITVALYVFLGGLLSAIFNEVLQFVLIWLGALLIAILGLIEAGGWNGVKERIAHNTLNTLASGSGASYTHLWSTLGSFSDNPMGIHWIGIVFGLGWVISFGYWTTDFLVVQRVIAAKDLRSARMAPIIGAAFKMLVPLIVILPGLLGLALLPDKQWWAKMLRRWRLEAHSYNEVLPLMLARYCGPGLLGLGITALIAGFMSGMAGNISAFSTVWTYGIYRSIDSVTDEKARNRRALRAHGPLVHAHRRAGEHRDSLPGDALLEHHGLRASAVQFLYRAVVRDGIAGHALEARDSLGRLLGIARGNGFIHRNVGVGEIRPVGPALRRAFASSEGHGGEYVSRAVVMGYLRCGYGGCEYGDRPEASE